MTNDTRLRGAAPREVLSPRGVDAAAEFAPPCAHVPRRRAARAMRAEAARLRAEAARLDLEAGGVVFGGVVHSTMARAAAVWAARVLPHPAAVVGANANVAATAAEWEAIAIAELGDEPPRGTSPRRWAAACRRALERLIRQASKAASEAAKATSGSRGPALRLVWSAGRRL